MAGKTFLYGCFVLCVGLIATPLIFICPALEFWKISLFNKNNLYFNKPVDYTYLILTLLNLILYIIFCSSLLRSNKKNPWQFIFATIVWLIIPIIYTFTTRNELGDVPLLCPPDYDYHFKELHTVCQVRTANLICMWIMGFSTLLVAFAMFIPDDDYREIARSVGYLDKSVETETDTSKDLGKQIAESIAIEQGVTS